MEEEKKMPEDEKIVNLEDAAKEVKAASSEEQSGHDQTGAETTETDGDTEKVTPKPEETPGEEVDGSELTFDSVAEEYGLTLGEVHTAKRAQLTPQDVKDMGPEAAKRVIGVQKKALDNWAAKLGELGEKSLQKKLEALHSQQQQPQQPRQQERQDTPPPESDWDSYNIPQDIKQKLTSMEQKLQQYESERNQQQAAQTQQAMKQNIDRADSFVSSLPEAYRKKFGEGSIFDLPQGSPEWKQRDALYRYAGAIREGAIQSGEQMSVEDAVATAISVKEPELMAMQTREQIIAQVSRQQNSVIGSGQSRTKNVASMEFEEAANKITQNAPDKLKNL